MKTLNCYMDNAKKYQGFRSDNMLGQALGFSGSGINYWRQKKSFPSEDKMIKLAELAGEDKELALIDLAIWRSSAGTQQIYASILHKLTQSTLLLLVVYGFTCAPSPSHASPPQEGREVYSLCDNVYYGK